MSLRAGGNQILVPAWTICTCWMQQQVDHSTISSLFLHHHTDRSLARPHAGCWHHVSIRSVRPLAWMHAFLCVFACKNLLASLPKTKSIEQGTGSIGNENDAPTGWVGFLMNKPPTKLNLRSLDLVVLDGLMILYILNLSAYCIYEALCMCVAMDKVGISIRYV